MMEWRRQRQLQSQFRQVTVNGAKLVSRHLQESTWRGAPTIVFGRILRKNDAVSRDR
jgi:hypothetical protein